jgi:hypothetical protein
VVALFRGANGAKHDTSQAGERLEPTGVGLFGVIEGIDEDFAEELDDVLVVEQTRKATEATTRGGTALAAGRGQGFLMGVVVEEAEGAVRKGAGSAGLAVRFGTAAACLGHGELRYLGVQAFRRLDGERRAECSRGDGEVPPSPYWIMPGGKGNWRVERLKERVCVLPVSEPADLRPVRGGAIDRDFTDRERNYPKDAFQAMRNPRPRPGSDLLRVESFDWS